ncbi:MAG: hypothetical protein IPL79_20405 [Myxococcales bacterium]|nr:hypothetical protein [Myxococcales bacterium]
MSKSGTITYTIEPTELTRSVGLVGVSAAEATIEVLNPADAVLVTRTRYLADYSEMVDALAMVTIEPRKVENAIFEDIICQPGNRIEITIGDGAGTVEISEIIIGNTITVGDVVFGATIGIDDFSAETTDGYGNVSITRRGYRDVTKFPVVVKTGDVKRLRRKLAGLRAKFALFYHTADDTDYGTTVFGRYESLEMILSGPTISDLELIVKGATYDA